MKRSIGTWVLTICFVVVLGCGNVTHANAEDWKQYLEGAQWVTDPNEARGGDYTEHPYLSAKLDEIFHGSAALYTDYECTEPYRAPIGSNSVPIWGEMLCVPGNQRGWSCYIYANGAYYALFGECPGDGDNEYLHSETIYGLSGTADTLYAEMTAAGVTQTGAYCRNYSHSFLILSYDEEGIVLLDGNSINGGDGFIQITEATWDYFYEYFLGNGGNPIDHIVQPTEEYLLRLYLDGNAECTQAQPAHPGVIRAEK